MSQLITGPITDPRRVARVFGTLQSNVKIDDVPDLTAEWILQHPAEAGKQFTRFLKELPSMSYVYEFRIQKHGTDAATLISRTRANHFFVPDHLEKVTRSAEFVIGPKENVVIRVFRHDDLGFTPWLVKGMFSVRKVGNTSSRLVWFLVFPTMHFMFAQLLKIILERGSGLPINLLGWSANGTKC